METIGELIEKLIIENIRLWVLQDIVSDNNNESIVAKTAKQILAANAKRSAIRAEISQRLGESEVNIKIYGKNNNCNNC